MNIKIKEGFVQFVTTVMFFYIEALIHYNIGKHGYLKFTFPKLKENLLILLVIIIFSCLSSMASYCVINYLL